MINPFIVIFVMVVYAILMIAIALYAEKKFAEDKKKFFDNGIIYSLTLALYCTAWTFYGNIGLAVSNSFLFLAVYIGATLSILAWWYIVRVYVKKRNEYGLTSIADFLAFRYGRSQSVGVIATIIAIVGILPYIALQLEGVLSSFSIFIGDYHSSIPFLKNYFDVLILGILFLFTIILGMRKLDLTERHPGIIAVVAVQSIVKIIAFLAAGIFIVYFLYNGVGDIFNKASADPFLLTSLKDKIPSFSLWFSYLLISMSAIIFLPRQFHVTVVENNNEKTLRTAIWALPLYFLLITFFVLPIAIAGLLHGFPVASADYFMPLLIIEQNIKWLGLLVFMGGFAAASSMVVVETLAMTTMATNYLIFPVIEKVSIINFLRRFLLQIRWLVAGLVILLAYFLKTQLGTTYILVKIGTISFAAALQFAPAMLGAIFWKKANRVGASLGMLAGFIVWGYTSFFPAFVRSGLIISNVLVDGPFGIKLLRPENLFGAQVDWLSNTVMFSLLFNVSFFVLGSLLFKQTDEGKIAADSFCNTLDTGNSANSFISDPSLTDKMNINNNEKKNIAYKIFSRYLIHDEAEALVGRIFSQVGVENKKLISIKNLTDLHSIIEKSLLSYTGASVAKDILHSSKFISSEESGIVSQYYARLISELMLSPVELAEKLNYSEEKQKLLQEQSSQLETAVENRTRELQDKVLELERFQALTIDREIRMVELKNKIKELKVKAPLV